MLNSTPKEGIEPIGTVIWLHGLGASEYDFAPVVPHMQLPDVRFVFHMLLDAPDYHFEGDTVRAWYDITTLGQSSERESMADVMISARLIEALIEREIERGSVQKYRTDGVSQGGAMALHVGHRFYQPLMAVLILSGYMLNRHSLRRRCMKPID